MDALGIVEALKALRADAKLTERLSAGALAFCEEHFNWSKNTGTLERFYERVRVTPPEPAHDQAPTIS
jgi:glycosyltransferase involved in cell wall biosynthesis